MSVRDTAKERSVREDWDGVYVDRCKANGCPCPASVITDYGDARILGTNSYRKLPKQGLCGFHFQLEAHQWQRATKVLRENLAVLNAMQRLCNRPVVELDKTKPQQVGVDVETKPKEGECAIRWRGRMRELLKARIAKAMQ